jgi:dienelactone hydrolase
MKTKIISSILFTVIFMTSMISISKAQKSSPMMKEENISYTIDGKTYSGFIVYDQNINGKRPAVLVVHEWWGENDYTKMRARQLASLGYIAMAVDLFGSGTVAANPQEAMALTKPFYGDPNLAKTRLDAAIRKIKEYPQTDASNVAAIGYCFGGWVVLNSAKLGSDLKGIVSFHGGLTGAPANKDLLKAKILVCHGDSDKFVSLKDVDLFKHQMDSIGANYTYKSYANATHAFTNPDATKIGQEFNMPIKYNAEADKNSWNDMNNFFAVLFKK